MNLKLIVILTALLVLSACDMEKSFRTNEDLNYDIYNQIGRELADDLYFIWEDHYEHEGYKREIREDVNIYSEDIYLATMKIMDSYGIDTNRFHRSTISISLIWDLFENFSSDKISKKYEIDISRIKNATNIALVKTCDYNKYIRPLLTKAQESNPMFNHFISYEISNINFITSNTARFNISYVVGPLIAKGREYYISKKDELWKIDSSRVTWVS